METVRSPFLFYFSFTLYLFLKCYLEIMDEDEEEAEQPPAHSAAPSSNDTPEATPEKATKIEPQKAPPSSEVSVSS